MQFHLLHPRDQLVIIMQRIYDNGMTTLSGGNLSIKDENGDLWITPAGVDKGKLTPKDIICLHADGKVEGVRDLQHSLEQTDNNCTNCCCRVDLVKLLLNQNKSCGPRRE